MNPPKDPNIYSFKEWNKLHKHKSNKKRRLFKAECEDGIIRYYRCGRCDSTYIKSSDPYP